MRKNIILLPIIGVGLGLCLNTYTFRLKKIDDITTEEITINNQASIIDIIKTISETTSKINKENQEKKESEQKKPIIIPAKKEHTNNNISILDQIKLKKDHLGTYGRLYLPTINHSVAVYYANVYNDENYNAQQIVDREDSAAYYKLGEKYIIADHHYQGFKKIINLNAGTKGYIKMNDGTIKTYYLKNKLIGENIGVDLTDENGNSIQTLEGSLVMYTCYTSDKKIMITLWDEVI